MIYPILGIVNKPVAHVSTTIALVGQAGSARTSLARSELPARLGRLKSVVEKLHQLFESSFRVLPVIDAATTNHPAVLGIVHLALVLAAPRASAHSNFSIASAHALVVGGVAEVKPRFHAWQDEMRAVDSVGEQSAAVE